MARRTSSETFLVSVFLPQRRQHHPDIALILPFLAPWDLSVSGSRGEILLGRAISWPPSAGTAGRARRWLPWERGSGPQNRDSQGPKQAVELPHELHFISFLLLPPLPENLSKMRLSMTKSSLDRKKTSKVTLTFLNWRLHSL